MLALGLGTLTACGVGSAGEAGEPDTPDRSAPPPTAAATSDPSGTASGPTGDSLQGKTIVIDPGHNGGNGENPSYVNRKVDVGNGKKACDTTGTQTAGGYTESAFNWDVSNRLAKLLRERGAKVILTRSNDTGVGPCITRRAAIGNDNKADAALSVHADGAPPEAHGFHIIEPKAVRGLNESIVPDSHKLGLALRDAFRKGTGLPYSTYRGTKAMDPRDDLGGLNLSKVPKVFIECGNMKNPTEARKFVRADFRQKIAVSLANGFATYFTR